MIIHSYLNLNGALIGNTLRIINQMHEHCDTPMPTPEEVRRLKKLHVRRKRPCMGRKHIPPIPGEYLYYDNRLENSGYWTINMIPCHFSFNGKQDFGPFVQRFGRHKGVRSEYIEIDSPNPRQVRRPSLQTSPERALSPDWSDLLSCTPNYSSDEL